MSDFKHFHSVKNTFSLSQTEYIQYLSIIKYNELSSLQQTSENYHVTEKFAQPIEVEDKNFFWATRVKTMDFQMCKIKALEPRMINGSKTWGTLS